MNPTRLVAILLLSLLLPACGPDEAPKVEIPSWAKVAPEQIAEAKKHGVPVAFENDLGMRFVLIPAGTFLMTLPERGVGTRRGGSEFKQVAVARPFYMSIHEVTNRQFREFDPSHRSSEHPDYAIDGAAQPVAGVSWEQAVAFCSWAGCRLPSDIEWERAVRGGYHGQIYPWGDADDPAMRNGEGAEDGHAQAAPVGRFPPNPFGLYDMVGNVWEWCSDEAEVLVVPMVDDIVGFRMDGTTITEEEYRQEMGTQRVMRGGSWFMWPDQDARSVTRSSGREDNANIGVGIRLVSPLPEPGE